MSVEQAARTPHPWPDNAEPTNEQLAEWLAVCTPAERLGWIVWLRLRADRGRRCFEQDHERRLERLDAPGAGRHRR